MQRDKLQPILEAILFAAGEPLTIRRISAAITDADAGGIRETLQAMQQEYDNAGRGFLIEESAGGWQMLSRQEHAELIAQLIRTSDKTKLSPAAFETLAIIAYRQPIGRAAIENIRGVQAGPMLRALLDRRLIKITGREEVPGRPFLYGTTRQFLERMGLRSLKDLPKAEEMLRDIKQ